MRRPPAPPEGRSATHTDTRSGLDEQVDALWGRLTVAFALIWALILTLVAVIASLVLAPPARAAAYLDDCPALILETFGDRSGAACAVAWCETGGTYDPYATGAAGERGWFQIHPIHGWRSSYDPEVNVAYAYQLSRGGTDWRHWSCKPFIVARGQGSGVSEEISS